MHDLRVLKHFLYVPLALLLLGGCEYFNLSLDKFTETHTAVISVESVTFDTATAGRFLPDSGTYVLEPPSPLDNVTVYINLKNDVNLAFDCALTGTVNDVDTPGRITAVETGERRLRVNIANPVDGERYDIRLAIRAESGRSFNISVPPILYSARWTPGVGTTVINALGAVTDIAAPVHDAPSTNAAISAATGYTGSFAWTSGLSGGTSGGYVYGTPAVATVTLIADTGCTFTGTAIDAAAIQTVFSSGSPAAVIQGTPGATLVFTLTYTVAQATLSGTVSIDGTAQWNQALTANIAGINPSASASDYTYQWKRGGVDISGGNNQTYTLTAADEAKIISVEVSRTGYASSITGAIGAPVNSIGGTGEAGGIIFYVITSATVYPGKTYLEAAPANISGYPLWASSSFFTISIPGTQWGIGTGAANTAAILGIDSNAPAAKACADYRAPTPYNTFNDWFLPSKDELYAMWTSGITGTLANPLNGFTGSFYWSSSEYSTSSNAWMQYFSDGNLYPGPKQDTRCVRAVRAF
ncbi:hypothetical protein AGMMS50268_04340 [Spirochaetia bacterium]|nr:hypothetical protein AGMMS50268_04340 [Spirochaetia bacterium]